MTATITSKGQITIPLKLRQKLRLKAGDKLEFDEQSSGLKARKVVDKAEWTKNIAQMQKDWATTKKETPWANLSAGGMLEEMRGSVDLPPQ